MKKISVIISLLISLQSFSQADTSEVVGDVLEYVLPMSAVLTPLIIKDKKGIKQAAATIAATTVVTLGLKRIINKPRPNGGNYSFPSGHTSNAFSGAAFIQRRYGWKFGAPMYALAMYTGWSRVNANAHDYWDVTGGAVIAVGFAYLFTNSQKAQNLNVSVGKKEGKYLLSVNYKF